jgi:hypothetical protein
MAMFEYECDHCKYVETKLFFGSEHVPDKIPCEKCNVGCGIKIVKK